MPFEKKEVPMDDSKKDTSRQEFRTSRHDLEHAIRTLEAGINAIVNKTRLGRTLRKEATNLRPTLPQNDHDTPVSVIIHTFQAEEIIDQLVADTEFGPQNHTYLWARIHRHPQTLFQMYPVLIEIAYTKERNSELPASVRQRARTIRVILEREYEMEKYVEYRSMEIKRRKLSPTKAQEQSQPAHAKAQTQKKSPAKAQ